MENPIDAQLGAQAEGKLKFASCEVPLDRPIVRKAWLVILLLTAAILGVIGPALVHKDNRKQIEAAQVAPPSSQPSDSGAMRDDPTAMPAQMGEMMEEMSADRSKITIFERVLD